jgi:hypothetical protein
MENNNKPTIQKTAPTDLVTLPADSLVKAVYQFNQLRAFSLTQIEVLEWARSIERLHPNVDINQLMFVIDQMKVGNLEYDKTIGIQNIFKGLKMTEKTKDGFKVLRALW